MYSDNDKVYIYLYNNYLLNDEKLPTGIFEEKSSIIVLKYCNEVLLRWTPEEMRDNFNQRVINDMKLQPFIDKIQIPVEYDPNKDFYYYAHLCYPSKIKLSDDIAVIRHYEEVLSKKVPKFKRGFLEGAEGEHRMKICLKHAIEKEGFHSSKELYQLFSQAKGNTFLRKYNLDGARRGKYSSAIEFLHDTLSESQRDYDYYNYYKFMALKL